MIWLDRKPHTAMHRACKTFGKHVFYAIMAIVTVRHLNGIANLQYDALKLDDPVQNEFYAFDILVHYLQLFGYFMIE